MPNPERRKLITRAQLEAARRGRLRLPPGRYQVIGSGQAPQPTRPTPPSPIVRQPQGGGSTGGSGGRGIVAIAIILLVLAIAGGGGATIAGVGGGHGSSTPKNGAYGAALLAQAKSYDSESYVWGGGHQAKSWHSGAGVDCSGLVIQVTGVVTHGKVDESGEVVSSFPGDGHWKVIKISQAQPGDILLRLTGSNLHDHVAFVVSNHHNGLFDLFAAWTSNAAQQADEVGLQRNDSGSWYTEAARFIG